MRSLVNQNGYTSGGQEREGGPRVIRQGYMNDNQAQQQQQQQNLFETRETNRQQVSGRQPRRLPDYAATAADIFQSTRKKAKKLSKQLFSNQG